MQSNVTRALPLLLSLWFPGALLAQDTTTEEPGQPEAVTTEDVTEEDTTPEADAGAGEKAERSPHDYRPSEDISEDLSVSFPVDI